MKLRKILSVVVALAMIGTLAIAVNAAAAKDTSKATITLKVEGYEGVEPAENEIALAGGEVRPPKDSINYAIIRKVRFTFNLTKTNPDEETGNIPVAAIVNCPGGSSTWKQQDFDYSKEQSYTFDLSEYKWNDEAAEGINWLKVAAVCWSDGNEGTVLVEVLDENGKVLPVGFGTDDKGVNLVDDELEAAYAELNDGGTPPAATTPVATTAGAGTTTVAGTGGGLPLDTGAGGVAVLGAVAILAAGAVVISRKK